jgi:hypothetical protein
VHRGNPDELGDVLIKLILIDCEEVKDKGIKFHYAWLLILIALSSWREPDDTHIFGSQGESMSSYAISEPLVYYAQG